MQRLKTLFLKKNNQKKRSIARTLILLLIITITAVSTTTLSVIYLLISHKEKIQLEKKADQFILSLAGILEIPLWNLDYRNIEKIGEAYKHNDLFEILKITDHTGAVHFNFNKKNGFPVVTRNRNVLHGGQVIGHVEIALTEKILITQNRKLLVYAAGALVIIIFVLTAVTGVFFRVQLSKIFDRMDQIADAYASGLNGRNRYDMPFIEFRPLISILGNMRDKLNSQITALQNAEKKYRSIFENAVEGIFQITPDEHIISINPAMARILEYESPEELAKSITDIDTQLYLNPEKRKEFIRQMMEGKEVSGFQVQFYTKNRHTVWISLHARPVFNDKGEWISIEGIAQDITLQKKSEEQRHILEQQLFQAQKMELVGRLAGGVAHDFNNMLNIILGYSNLILEELPLNNPYYGNVLEIKKTAQRSANLTRQLLAFARKQTVSPKILDLNETISGMLKMLQRLLGEDIELIWTPGYDIASLKIDPTQIDQILANLCINSRDAIKTNGKITIETMNVILDETYCRNHPQVITGKYVMLAVSDNGCGMDESILNHIFEPFYTSKDSSHGTGLGLATVYGIVKQNNGIINVYSEPDNGTTFKIYLPAYTGEAAEVMNEVSTEIARGGNETILLVEDEADLLILTKRMLEKLGYTVFSSNSSDEALLLFKEHKEDIQLLITDVIMPEMNGRDLYERLMTDCNNIKCLFMSGYTANVIAHQGILDEGLHFIQKPFSKEDLAFKIREILDEE